MDGVPPIGARRGWSFSDPDRPDQVTIAGGFGQISVCVEVGLKRFERFWTAFSVVASGFDQISVSLEVVLKRFARFPTVFLVAASAFVWISVCVEVALERFGRFWIAF